MANEPWDGRWPNTETDFPAKGERVFYDRKLPHTQQREQGYGRVELVWCGVEPVIDLDTGLSLYPCLGDTWERVP